MNRLKGFTLIELLVVISIIAMLLALLLPTLTRVKKQAKAVVCQSNLKQWGTIWATFTTEHDGHFPIWDRDWAQSERPGWWWGWWGLYKDREQHLDIRSIRCCPMAAKPTNQSATRFPFPAGGTYLAWGSSLDPDGKPWDVYGSYGISVWIYNQLRLHEDYEFYWNTPNIKNASRSPVQLDSCWPHGRVWQRTDPPEHDAVPVASSPELWDNPFCINRHDAHVNCLFMDWSVRKVGLKELWTLKWHRLFNTAGAWTVTGGVQTENWPHWMRSFKDY